MSRRTVITIFDYGAGNIHSLMKALDIGDTVEIRLERDPIAAISTDALVLPGVGAFNKATDQIGDATGAMRDAINGGLPALCICLGMHLLFDSSEEGLGSGLGVIPGHVRRLRASRVPQIGWNEIESFDESLPEEAYFANSFVCEPEDPDCVVAYTTHETDRFASVVTVANAVGVQFHPEKSSSAGVSFVRKFVRGVCQ